MIQKLDLEDNKKRTRPPRQPKKGQYTLVNSYNQPPSKQFILTLFLFIGQVSLHSVFVARPMVWINQTILFIMWAFHYMLIVVIGYDYIVLTCTDPVDRSLIDSQIRPRASLKGIWYCEICSKNMAQESYHCNRCNRCVQNFDHHCTFLNNCIGGRNYQNFLRILFIMILYNINCIGQGVWVFVSGYMDQTIEKMSFSRWAVLVFIILSFIILITVCVLLGLHIYLNCISSTTLEYLQNEFKKEMEAQKKKRQNKQTGSSQHLKNISAVPSSDFLNKNKNQLW